MFKFYTYIYLNPLKAGDYNYGKLHFDFEPFYVGKGFGNRCNVHMLVIDTRNKLKQNIINKILIKNKNPIIIILYSSLTEYSAFRIEKYLIKEIGRRDKKLGTLSNLSDGGEGNAGVIYNYERRVSMISNNKPILKYDDNGNIIERFKNIVDLSFKYPELRTNHIHRACKCNGRRKIDNYFWKYWEGEEIDSVLDVQDKFKSILQYDLNGKYLKTWGSANDILSNLGYASGAILKCCRNNKQSLSYKFKNSMWFFKTENIKPNINEYDKTKAKGYSNITKNKIKMISLNDEIINIYTPRQLKNLGFFTKTIYGCCNNKFQTSQGYKWEWDDVKIKQIF